MNLADEHGIDIDEDIAAHLDVAANVDAGRIRQRRAGEHQFLRALTPQTRFDFAKLNLVVDARDLQSIRRRNRLRCGCPACAAPATTSVRKYSRWVLFLPSPKQPLAQASRRRRHET